MLTFAAAVFFLIATPGPGVLSAAGIGSSYGYRAGIAYIGGLCIGNAIVGGLVVSGLAAIALAFAPLRIALAIATTLYFAYLASRIAFAGARVGFIHPATSPGLKDGILLQFINPKAYAVNTFLFAGFSLGLSSEMTEVLVKFLIFNAIWIPLHLVWLSAGVMIQRMELGPRTQRRVNYAMAIALLCVVGLSLRATIAP